MTTDTSSPLTPQTEFHDWDGEKPIECTCGHSFRTILGINSHIRNEARALLAAQLQAADAQLARVRFVAQK